MCYKETNKWEVLLDVNLFKLPVIEENSNETEKAFCEILKKYRSGEPLEPEVLDWFDAANAYFITSETKGIS